MENRRRRLLEDFSSLTYKMIAEGAIVGLLSGVVVAIFRIALEKGEVMRNALLSKCFSGHISMLFSNSLSLGYILIFLLIMTIGWFIVSIIYKWQPLSSGSGIPQVRAELLGQLNQPWYKIIIAKIIGGVVAVSCGLSLGREGPSIQLGAMVGKGYASISAKRPTTEEKLLLTCGAGAGLAGAFAAPLAGVIFSLEELHKNFSKEVLLSSMAACITSNFISLYIFGLDPVFNLYSPKSLPLTSYWVLVVMGITIGLFGRFYNWLTDKVQSLYDKISSKAVRMTIPFIMAILLAFSFPYVLGSGHHLIKDIVSGNFTIGFLVVLLLIKLFFSVISFGSGAPGGIFLPLLVLGAITGGIFGSYFIQSMGYSPLFMDNFLIFGMTAMFSAVVRAPITGVILITEMSGDFKNFLPLAFVALISYVVADLTKGIPIYDQLLDRLLEKNMKTTSDETMHKRFILEFNVHVGSIMDGRPLKELSLPESSLIVAINRKDRELIPRGDTKLRGGDKLLILVTDHIAHHVEKKIHKLCKELKR